jgi:hypothetical protein
VCIFPYAPGAMDSYSIVAVYRSRRRESCARKMGEYLSRRDAGASLGLAGGVTCEVGKESPCNWMRRGLAHIRKQSG